MRRSMNLLDSAQQYPTLLRERYGACCDGMKLRKQTRIGACAAQGFARRDTGVARSPSC
jgi:hypothetical protein